MTEFPLELGTGAIGQKLECWGYHADGRKSFKIDLAVYTQYRRVTDVIPASHLSTAKTALTHCVRRAVKKLA